MDTDTPKKGASPSPASRKSAIETMSQEELVKTTKKQMIFLQKLKAKCDDLQSKLAAQADYEEIKSRLDDAGRRLEEKNGENHTEVLKTNHALTEEVDCLKRKQGTLVSTMQCLQTEHDKLVADKQALSENIEELVAEKIENVKNFEVVKTQLEDVNDQLCDKNQQLHALKDHIKKLKESEGKFKESCRMLEDEKKETKNELAAVKISMEMFKKSMEEDKIKIEECDLKIVNLQEELDKTCKENKILKESEQEFKNEVDAASQKLSENFSHFETENNNLRKKLEQKQFELEKFQKTVKEKILEVENLSAECCEKEVKLKSALEEQNRLQGVSCNLTKEVKTLHSRLVDEDVEKCKEVELLREELSQVQRKLDKVVADAERKRRDEVGHETVVKNLNETIQKHLATIRGLTDQVEDDKLRLSDLTSVCDRMQQENNAHCLKIHQLQETLNFKEATLESDQVTNQIKADYDITKTECEELKLKLANLEENEKISNEKCTSLEENYNLLKEKVEATKQEKLSLEEKLKQETGRWEALQLSSTNLQEELQKLRDNEAKWKQEVEKINEKNLQMKQDLDKSLAENKSLKEDEQTKMFAQELQAQLHAVKEEKSELEEKIGRMESEYHASLDKLRSSVTQVKELRSAKDEVKKRNCGLLEEVRLLKIKMEEAVNDKQTSTMKEEIRKLTEQLDTTLSQSQHLSRDNSNLQQTVITLTNQNDELTSSLTSKNEAEKNLILNLEKEAKMRKELEGEVAGLRTQVAGLQIELKSKHGNVNKEQEISDLNSKVILLESAIKESSESIKQKSEEMSRLQDFLQQNIVDHEEELRKMEYDRSNQVLGLQAELEANKEKLVEVENEMIKKEEEYMKTFSQQQATSLKLQQDNDELNVQVQELLHQIENLKVSKFESGSSAEKNVELETLQQNIKEKESYIAKLKVIAVKTRKELEVVKSQLQSTREENNQFQDQVARLNASLLESKARVMSGAQTLQVECDRLQDEIDQIQSEKSEIQKEVEGSRKLIDDLRSQKQESVSKLSASLLDVDRIRSEKKDVELALLASKSFVNKLEKEKENLMKDNNSMKREMEACRIQVTSLSKQVDEKRETLVSVETSLAQANKRIQQHDLMSLEMAQYEATLCGLQTQVSDLETIVREKDEKINDLELKVSELNEDRRTIEELRLDAEERVTRSKEALDTTREQVARLSELEHESKGHVDKLTEQLEHSQLQCDDYKLNLASKTRQCHELEEKVSSLKMMQRKSTEILERKIQQSQEERNRLKSEKDSLLADYESYKVRVHSVLKQQKNKEVHHEVEDGRISTMKSQLAQLQSKLSESENVLVSRDHELDLLQADYDRLLRQQQQSSEGALERETRWKSRVKSLQQELVALRKQHDDVNAKLSQQRDVMAELVANAVEHNKTEHEAELTLIQAELKRKDAELMELKNEVKKLNEEKPNNPTKRAFPSPTPYRPHAAVETSVDYRSVAREAGEGEEQADDGSVISFEQILQSSRIQSVTEMKETESVTSEVQVKQLEAKFAAQKKQLEHSTEVARESEATASRLADQNRVLKEEIRRLEKNQERDKSVSNMEYLKNVVYKFLTLPPCDERKHLVPVMDTMLRLSKEERIVIQALAAGDESSDEQPPSGWGSYLQRWSGMQ